MPEEFPQYLFVTILILFSLYIMWINKGRNAWDILFFNSTLAIISLFMVGILAKNLDVWKIVAIALGVIATGEKIVGFFISGDKER